jgi:hypothetical protein
MENRRGSAKQPRYSLIVEISIENTQVVRRRAARQTGVSFIPLECSALSNSWTHLGRRRGEEENFRFRG